MALLFMAGCAAGDPCASGLDSAQPNLTIGQATAGTQFVPVDPGGDRELVMGEQGVAMFHRLALRAEHLAPLQTGRTSVGWSLAAHSPAGVPLGEVWSPHLCRASPDGFEVVDIRLVPTPPPLTIWDTDIILQATAQGRCGGQAEAQVTVRAVRVGDAR